MFQSIQVNEEREISKMTTTTRTETITNSNSAYQYKVSQNNENYGDNQTIVITTCSFLKVSDPTDRLLEVTGTTSYFYHVSIAWLYFYIFIEKPEFVKTQNFILKSCFIYLKPLFFKNHLQTNSETCFLVFRKF